MPAPYQGYQPANAHAAPPPYGQAPTQYAQFDSHAGAYRGNTKTTEDSLPAMPSWGDARETRVEDHEHKNDMELGNLQKPATASMADLSQSQRPQHTAVSDLSHDTHTGYTGPDFGAGAGRAQPPPQHQQYTGPDFSAPSPGVPHTQNTGYSAYAPSESTRYEPSHMNEPQELGTTYDHIPMSPHGGNGPPTALQAGRKAGEPWREV
ncbi:uncharacterized protein KY384_002554 [Bacidia gigantensis]|uniref:uncharacterized protein n=1 Tax=Bacidia gigantensis TaxID=2732470 RepID=UPI001D0579DC|nr:uncharacterized protein KY384_002554 [Bacidia gigantensis]KAG8532677.1 hypothetical protein KY384_002554 [Bacidia gigantensis]